MMTKTMKVESGDGSYDPWLAANAAILKAADIVEYNHYCAKYTAHIKKGRKPKTFRDYEENRQPHPVTNVLVEMAPKVLSGEVTPDEAMAYLLSYEVMEARFPKNVVENRKVD